MTDNEIIKGFEAFCLKFEGKATDFCCLLTTLDLIKRQKAEIERLEAEIDKQYEQARADILGNMADGGTSCHWCIDQHKAEAIKDFAERLKNSMAIKLDRKFYFPIIDNLVKEMVGDGE